MASPTFDEQAVVAPAKSNEQTSVVRFKVPTPFKGWSRDENRMTRTAQRTALGCLRPRRSQAFRRDQRGRSLALELFTPRSRKRWEQTARAFVAHQSVSRDRHSPRTSRCWYSPQRRV